MTRTESSKRTIGAPGPRKVKQMRFHIGVQIPGTVKNSLDSEKDKCVMTLQSNFVVVEIGDSEIVVPMSNIHYMELLKA